MTTTANPLLENCCGCCGDGGCKNTWAINIQSTNPECLRVDTSECWVVKLEPVCPPVVVAWDKTITVEVEDCEEGESCSKKYKVKANIEDEKVKACPNDTKAWTLIEKLEAWHAVTITANWCDWDTNSTLVIDVDESKLNLDTPHIKVKGNSKLINLSAGWDEWHTLFISDKESATYNNVCCIGFTADQDFSVEIDEYGNSVTPLFMWESSHYWSIFTGNQNMATKYWLKILADGYYRLFWQITVENNINEDYYFNLWRWLLRVNWKREALNDNMYLSTAKHWAYARQILLTAWTGIDISWDWEISTGSWEWQPAQQFTWPWMTYNIDTLVDLREWDVITLGYRPQSNLTASHRKRWTFRFVWQNDSSTGFNALFGWTLLWAYQISPKCFQEGEGNEVYWNI